MVHESVFWSAKQNSRERRKVWFAILYTTSEDFRTTVQQGTAVGVKLNIRHLSRCIWAITFLAILSIAVGRAQASMFLPPKSVASKIRIDGKGFVINGKRVFVVSGSFHYPRVPRAMWANRMEKMKRAGFNCLSTYIFWNYQEPREGQFDFHGRHNIVAFVKLAQKMGFYVILRIGPWDCAEWDSGGYPVWLRFIPGLAVRHADKPYIAALRQYYHKLLPQLIPLQVTHGGPVIMIQLENEDLQGWGAVLPNRYYKYLYHECVKFGVDVPFFFSGQHHSPDPAGKRPFNHSQDSSPWFSTEMWSGWFTQYGEWPVGSQKRRRMTRAPWDVIANGGAGYNVYMTIGGTNFSHWNNQSNQASYDFGAPVGQGGDLRPSYYNYKLANYFGRSFQSVLADSVDVTAQYKTIASGCHIAARRSRAGTIVFLRNFSAGNRTVVSRVGGRIVIPANRTIPIILHYKINRYFKINALCGMVFGCFRQQPGVESLVLYGRPGSRGLLRIHVLDKNSVSASKGFTRSGGLYSWKIRFKSGSPQLRIIRDGTHVLRVLAMSNMLARHTWIVHSHGRRLIVWGPHYVGQSMLQGKNLVLAVQRPMLSKKKSLSVGILSSRSTPVIRRVTFKPVPSVSPPALGAWQWRPDDAPASVTFNDSSWLSCVNPRQMGADDYPGAYEWYRASLNVPITGNYILELPGIRNYAEIFINGRMRMITGSGFRPIRLRRGTKTLAVFTVNQGRSKMWGYEGLLADVYKMGMYGPVKLTRQVVEKRQLAQWRIKDVYASIADVVADILSNEPGHKGWSKLKAKKPLSSAKTGYWWLRAMTGAVSADSLRFYIRALPDGAMLFVDGHQLTLNQAADGAVHTVMRMGWHHGNQPNRIDLLLPMAGTPVKFSDPMTMIIKDRRPAVGKTGIITPWKMHGGIGPINPKTGWKAGSVATGVPTFYKNSFTVTPIPHGVHRVLRVAVTGMGGGYVWINGHNLGRYPDHFMPTGLYIPSAWLHKGRNSIIVFDEQGHSPVQVRLLVYKAASRQNMEIQLPFNG